MLTPIEVALVALVGLQLILNHMRKTSCDERVQMVENECRRNATNFYTQINRQSFEIYKAAIESANDTKGKKSA